MRRWTLGWSLLDSSKKSAISRRSSGAMLKMPKVTVHQKNSHATFSLE